MAKKGDSQMAIDRLGADYYLLKPFDSDNLINRIRQVVSSEPFATKPRGERAYAPRDRGARC